MALYVLSQYKIQNLEDDQQYADLLSEDLIDVITNKTTRVFSDRNIAVSILEKDHYYKYLYCINVSLEAKR